MIIYVLFKVILQEKVYQEIIDVIGLEEEVGYKNSQALKYTQMVLKETLRLFPSLPQMSRQSVKDVKLS